MILVDTCVWSELMRKAPDSNVVAWMARNETAMSVITIQELTRGVELLPQGRRRDGLTGDAQIAAIAKARGLPVATRNVKHFTLCDVTVIDPFEGR